MRRTITEWTPQNLPTLDDIVAILGGDNNQKFAQYLLAGRDHKITCLGSGHIDLTSGPGDLRGADYFAVTVTWTDFLGNTNDRTLIQLKQHDDQPGAFGRMFNASRTVTTEELPWLAWFCVTDTFIREDGYHGFTLDYGTEEEAA